jgi:hypothetical protein
MPLRPQRLHHRIRNRLATALTLRAKPIRMAIDTPRIPLFLHKRHIRIKRITALRAEKVARVPLRATRDDNLALDGRRTALTPRTKALVEVQVAVEPRRLVGAILVFQALHFLRCFPAGQEGDVVAGRAGADAVYARGVLGAGFRVEGDAFELLAALVAAEALGVEPTAACGDDAPGDGEGAGGALGAGADGGGRPVGAGGGGEGARGGW